MTTQTTVTAAKAWAPDVMATFDAAAVIPEALALTIATQAGTVEGDAPAVRVPFVADNAFTTAIVPEGTEIPESSPALDELVINTVKVANLGRFSRELLAQPNAAEIIAASMSRAVVRKANAAMLSNDKSPVGLLTATKTVDGGAIGANLDTITDAVVKIEAAGGTATNIVAAPDAFGLLQKMKVQTGGNAPLLGAGTQAGERSVLGLPVTVSPDMPAGNLLVLDKGSVLAAYGQVQLAKSEDAYFTSDSVGVRVTFRLGWGIAYPDRVVKLDLTA